MGGLVLVVALPDTNRRRMRVLPKVPAALQRAYRTDGVVGEQAARSNEIDGVGNEAAGRIVKNHIKTVKI